MDATKVEAVRKWPRPNKIIEVQQFLGIVQYVRKFIRNFSEMVAPLTDLIRGAQMFKWTTREQVAFNKLKDVVCSQSVL